MPVYDVKKFVINSIVVNNFDTEKHNIIGQFGVTEYIDFNKEKTRRFYFKFKIDINSYTILIQDDGSLFPLSIIQYIINDFIIGTGVYNVITMLYGLKWSMNRYKQSDDMSTCFYFGDNFDD